MNSDFSLGRRRVNSFDGVSDSQPGNSSRFNNVDVLAIAADDPFWTDGEIPESGVPESDNQDEPDSNNSDDKNSDQDKGPNWFQRLTRKQWIIIAVVAVLVLGGGVGGVLALNKPDAKPTTKKAAVSKAEPAPAPAPKPTSPLTGAEVSDNDTKLPVIGMMIENSTFARPQSGLAEAGVVYEAIAEYGITRFLALYQEASPANIGPVRSARPYYVDWAHTYDAAYGHVGGSPDALNKIKADGVRDMDQFANSGSFHRIDQREAPHNVYTSGENMRALAALKGWTGSKFESLARKKESKSAQPNATVIDIGISGPTYNVHYEYDAASNTYFRTMGGEPHKDAESGKQLAPKVVIALAAPYGLMADGYHSTYETTGAGSVKIFQDGTVTEGLWKRDTTLSQYTFTDAAGKAIALNPGQTWITLIGDPAAASFK